LLLDFDLPMGVPRLRPNGRPLPCFFDYLRWRFRYPRAMVLLRTGAFYEAIGFDAVLLMEHCGLPAVAAAARCPRSMLPAATLRRTLRQLVEAGLTVVRWGCWFWGAGQRGRQSFGNELDV
jgi:hypothetical protein